MDRWIDQKAYFPIEMQFYISVMFLGLPDNILEEKSENEGFSSCISSGKPTNIAEM